MKRTIIALFLVLTLCLSLGTAVFAAPTAPFVIDEFGYLGSEELAALNQQAEQIYTDQNIGIFFVYTQAESLSDYDISTVVGDMTDYLVMMENETKWYCFTGGRGASLENSTIESLREVYDVADTYKGGVEDFLNAAAGYFPVLYTAPESEILPAEILVFDEAALLDSGEEAELTQKLEEISQSYDAQLVVYTLDAVAVSAGIDTYVEAIYDGNGFGYGENRDGVLLLVSMNPREYRILSNGFAGSVIGPDEIQTISNKIQPDLSAGNYAKAFDTFADSCEYYLDGAENGFPFKFGKNLLISLGVGLLIGLIVALILKAQLKSVRKQDRANVYVKPGSMQVTLRNDLFLYRNVSRTKKQSSNQSSGGGGSSRSVGGGSF